MQVQTSYVQDRKTRQVIVSARTVPHENPWLTKEKQEK